MQNIQLFYDAVSNIVFDANGKEYPIKEYNRCKQVNFNDGKIAVSKFKCSNCGHKTNADLNASKNIEGFGKAVVRQREALACA